MTRFDKIIVSIGGFIISIVISIIYLVTPNYQRSGKFVYVGTVPMMIKYEIVFPKKLVTVIGYSAIGEFYTVEFPAEVVSELPVIKKDAIQTTP